MSILSKIHQVINLKVVYLVVIIMIIIIIELATIVYKSQSSKVLREQTNVVNDIRYITVQNSLMYGFTG